MAWPQYPVRGTWWFATRPTSTRKACRVCRLNTWPNPNWLWQEDLPENLSEDGALLLEIGNERAHFEAAFPHLPVFWLDTSAGADQVLLITQAALRGGAGLR